MRLQQRLALGGSALRSLISGALRSLVGGALGSRLCSCALSSEVCGVLLGSLIRCALGGFSGGERGRQVSGVLLLQLRQRSAVVIHLGGVSGVQRVLVVGVRLQQRLALGGSALRSLVSSRECCS